MTVSPCRFVPITRPHLPAREEFTAIVEELFNTRMLSNFSKYSRLLEERAAVALDHPAAAVRLELRHRPDPGLESAGVPSG